MVISDMVVHCGWNGVQSFVFRMSTGSGDLQRNTFVLIVADGSERMTLLDALNDIDRSLCFMNSCSCTELIL